MVRKSPMQHLQRAVRALPRGLQHIRKELWQVTHLGLTTNKTPIFVVGFQRSGTSMFIEVLDRSPLTRLYGETRGGVLQIREQLTNQNVRRRMKRTFAPFVIFKPLNDAHNIDKFLNAFPNAKAVWLYRDYRDTALSAVKRWGGHQKDVIRRIARRDCTNSPRRADWRLQRLPLEHIELARRYYRPDMSNEEGAVLLWYIRHSFFYELKLNECPNVMLVKYEDLVCASNIYFKRAFDFFAIPFHETYTSHIFNSSVGKGRLPGLDPEIVALCEQLLSRLNDTYQASFYPVTVS